MKNEKPIIFSPEMVRAILAKKKTQTRRVIKNLRSLKFTEFEPGNWLYSASFTKPVRSTLSTTSGAFHSENEAKADFIERFCKYKVGDRLWVREAFFDHGDGCYEYKESPSIRDKTVKGKWKPAMYMPRSASRLTLEVTDLRVERIQEITEADAIAEGIGFCKENVFGKGTVGGMRHWLEGGSHSAGFKIAWNKMHEKKGFGWNQNPFVWVVGFKVVK